MYIHINYIAEQDPDLEREEEKFIIKLVTEYVM